MTTGPGGGHPETSSLAILFLSLGTPQMPKVRRWEEKRAPFLDIPPHFSFCSEACLLCPDLWSLTGSAKVKDIIWTSYLDWEASDGF